MNILRNLNAHSSEVLLLLVTAFAQETEYDHSLQNCHATSYEMAGINARREARMRRILENSESRLMKITGGNIRTEREESVTFSQAGCLQDELHNAIPNSKMNGVIPNAKCDKVFGNNMDISNTTENSNTPEIYNNTSAQLYTYKSSDVNNCLENACNRISGTHVVEQTNSYSNEYIDQTSQSTTHQTTAKNDKFSLAIFQSRALYLILAIIVNILVLLKLDYLFGKAIIIPCFTMISARLCTQRNSQSSQETSLLIAALILCNIKPEVMYATRRIMYLISTILYDCASYIFSFVLVQLAISYCTL